MRSLALLGMEVRDLNIDPTLCRYLYSGIIYNLDGLINFNCFRCYKGLLLPLPETYVRLFLKYPNYKYYIHHNRFFKTNCHNGIECLYKIHAVI